MNGSSVEGMSLPSNKANSLSGTFLTLPLAYVGKSFKSYGYLVVVPLTSIESVKRISSLDAPIKTSYFPPSISHLLVSVLKYLNVLSSKSIETVFFS